AHSNVPTATMYLNYTPASTKIRVLSTDDEQGICAAYPDGTAPTCGQPEPIYGFSKYCGGDKPSTGPEPPAHAQAPVKKGGCSMGAPNPAPNDAALFSALVLGSTALLRRRRT